MRSQSLGQGFRIDGIVVEPLNGSLTRKDGTVVRLEPKIMEVLSRLAAEPGVTVARSKLLDAVWGNHIAADELLTRAISEIRRALDDDPRNPSYICTVPKRGYRLIGDLQPLPAAQTDAQQFAFTTGVARVGVMVGLGGVMLFAITALMGLLTSEVSPGLKDDDVNNDPALPRVSGRPVPLTSTDGSEWGPALSPDGNYAAFVSSPAGNFKLGDIHVVEVGTAMPVALTNDPQANNRAPSWSPDGTRIAFMRSTDDARKEIVIKSVIGESETRLATFAEVWGHDWSPAGGHIAVALGDSDMRARGIHMLSISDGSLTPLIEPVSPKGDHAPRFSPDGKTLAFIRWNLDGSGGALCAKPLGDAPVFCLTPEDKAWPIRDFAWSPNGASLIVSVNGLVRVPLSGGPVEPLPFGDDAYNVATARNSNRLVYESFTEDSNLWRIPGPASSRGAPERFIASTRAELLPRYSPDGSRIAFVSGRTGDWEVWVANNDGSSARRLTDWGGASFPGWSPDGRMIAFSSGRYSVGRGEQARDDVGVDPDEAFSVMASGGVPRMISDGDRGAKAPSWSPDGKYLFFTRGRNDCGSEELWRRHVDTGEELRLSVCAWRPLASSDGRVYFFNKATRGVSSVSTAGGDERLELTIGTDCEPLHNGWTVWKSSLIYIDCQNHAIKMLDLESREVSELAPPLARQHLFEHTSLDVSPDGRWILFSRIDRAASDLILMEPLL